MDQREDITVLGIPLARLAIAWCLTNDDVSSAGEEYQYNYMGIAQFPKGLNEDWNLINRVVWNVPSVPLDQGKIDDFARGIRSFQPAGGGPSMPWSIGVRSKTDLPSGTVNTKVPSGNASTLALFSELIFMTMPSPSVIIAPVGIQKSRPKVIQPSPSPAFTT